MASFSLILGLFGNVVSILMFASPIQTFRRIINKKSTENYNSLPYITTLLSTSLGTFYGILKPGGLLVVTVNGIGAILHIFYVALYLVYAPNDVKVKTLKLVAMVDVLSFGAIILVTLVALDGTMRLMLVGILCAGLVIGMYAAPLAVMKTVIRTKSVEYMPFFLSFFQFLSAGIWTAYALVVNDIYIAVPNGVGFLLGSAQLILYVMYRNGSKRTESTEEMEEKGSAQLVNRIIEMQDIEKKDQKRRNFVHNKIKSMPKHSNAREYGRNINKAQSWTQDFSPISDEKNDNIEISLRH